MPHVGVVERGLVIKLTNFLLHAQKENNVPIHSLHPTHNFRRKDTSEKCGVSTQSVLFEVQDVSQICECMEGGKESLN